MLRLLPKSLPSTLAQPPGSPHVPLLSVFAALILAALAAFAWGIRDPRDGLAVCGGYVKRKEKKKNEGLRFS
jgi:hypothetical protein